MTPRPCKHIFGPVPSRRLGRSLGVDLVPFKTCTYDCIYCQLGRTTVKTTERKEYVPIAEVIAELDYRLAAGGPPDYVTLSGSGEPTLHAGLEEAIAGIKRLTAVPVAVLTNGSLLWDPAVRRGLAAADVVIPSLDAGNPEQFQTVNRPHPSLEFTQMLGGLLEFRRESCRQVWLEVFLLGGVTDTREKAAPLARLVREIAPDRIQLNTVARPPAESFARPVPAATMQELALLFGERTEVVAAFPESSAPAAATATAAEVLGLLRRRPCRLPDVAAGLNVHPALAVKQLAALERCGRIERDPQGFYQITAPVRGGPEGHRENSN